MMGIANRNSLRAYLPAAARRFVANCAGSVAVEYAVVAVIIGTAVAAGVAVLSGSVGGIYEYVMTAIGSG